MGIADAPAAPSAGGRTGKVNPNYGGPRPSGKGNTRRGIERARNEATAYYAPDLAMNDLEQQKISSGLNLSGITYDLSQRGNDIDIRSANRQPGYLQNTYNLDRLDLGIKRAANERQFGLIEADRKDNAADWGRMQEQLTRQAQQDTQGERMSRIIAAENRANSGVMGMDARAGVIQNRDTLGRQLAQNTADRAAGLQRFNAANRGFDESVAQATDSRNMFNSQGRRLDVDFAERMAGAKDDIERARIAKDYTAAKRAEETNSAFYDLAVTRKGRDKINADRKQYEIDRAPTYINENKQKWQADLDRWKDKQAQGQKYIDDNRNDRAAARAGAPNYNPKSASSRAGMSWSQIGAGITGRAPFNPATGENFRGYYKFGAGLRRIGSWFTPKW